MTSFLLLPTWPQPSFRLCTYVRDNQCQWCRHSDVSVTARFDSNDFFTCDDAAFAAAGRRYVFAVLFLVNPSRSVLACSRHPPVPSDGGLARLFPVPGGVLRQRQSAAVVAASPVVAPGVHRALVPGQQAVAASYTNIPRCCCCFGSVRGASRHFQQRDGETDFFQKRQSHPRPTDFPNHPRLFSTHTGSTIVFKVSQHEVRYFFPSNDVELHFRWVTAQDHYCKHLQAQVHIIGLPI